MKRLPKRTDALGFVALAVTALLGLGGAAALPAGLALGWPGVAALTVVGVSTTALALFARDGRALLGLLLVPALMPLAAVVPALRPLSGPPLLALAAGGVALVLWKAGRVPPAGLLVPVLSLVYCGVAARVQDQVGAEGDEPHYLMVAESLLRDRDLSLEPDYAERRYADYYRKPLLEPHYRVRGREGRIYSLHSVGLSVLILPAHALAGYAGVSFFMALLLALVVRELRELLRTVTERPGLAEGVAWVAGLSPPLVHYAGLVFTEVPAALLVLFVLRRGLESDRLGPGRAALLGLALAVLPWLNVRYALLALVLAAFVLLGRPRSRVALAFVLPGLVSLLGSATFHWILYGFFDPRLVYGRRPELSLATLPEGLPGLLLDQEFGLLVYAPVLILALPGTGPLMRSRRRLGLTSVVLALSVLVMAGSWHMWRGGFNPPARFLVPVVPLLWLGVACWLARGPRAAHALLVGWGLWAGLGGAWEPRLVHRDRDGTAPLFRTHAGAGEWTRILPGYVLGNPDRDRLALVWAALLVAAAVGTRRAAAPRSGSLVVPLGVLAVAVAAASSLAVARTGGRDAVRVLGRPALEVPGVRWQTAAIARWTPAALGWGPLYEPHRHPGGAEVGARLPLRPGRYELRVDGTRVPGSVEPPTLVVATEAWPPGRVTTVAVPMLRGEEGWRGELEVPGPSQATSLLLDGGSPFLLREVVLTRR